MAQIKRFCYCGCDQEYTLREYATHARAVVKRISGSDEDLPDFLEEWLAERIEDASTTETTDD